MQPALDHSRQEEHRTKHGGPARIGRNRRESKRFERASRWPATLPSRHDTPTLHRLVRERRGSGRDRTNEPNERTDVERKPGEEGTQPPRRIRATPRRATNFKRRCARAPCRALRAARSAETVCKNNRTGHCRLRVARSFVTLQITESRVQPTVSRSRVIASFSAIFYEANVQTSE